MKRFSIPYPLFVLAVTFVYGLIAYFWPDVPFDQSVFSLVVVAALSWLGIDVSAQVKAMRNELIQRGLMK